MAGGIDWFRWHHGSVTDPKFQLVARKSGQSLGNVIAVWAYVLEAASAAPERGRFGDIDHEAVDCMLGMEDGSTEVILAAMDVRGLIRGGVVASWEKRQPKREREDDKSTQRVQAFRQKHSHETPGNATERQETPRGEESREEQNQDPPPASQSSPPVDAGFDAASAVPAKPKKTDQWLTADALEADGIGPELAGPWLAHRRAKKAKLTELAWSGFKREADKAGWSYEAAVLKAIARNWTGFEAAWVAGDRATQASGETAYQRSMRERMAEVSPGLARKAPGVQQPLHEVFDVSAKRIS